jgi:hypothetical protein
MSIAVDQNWAIICLTVVVIVLSAINSIWAYKRTQYNRRVTQGSEKYWQSWKDRSKDIAKRVLKDISDEDLVKELEQRTERAKRLINKRDKREEQEGKETKSG